MEYSSVSEQLVNKCPSSEDNLKRLGIGAGALLLSAAVIFVGYLYGLIVPGIMIACAIAYGGYFLFTSTYIEYEYSVFDGTLDIDKIIAQRKRSHLLSVKISSFDSFAEVGDNDDNPAETTVFALGDDGKSWYADFNHPDYGKARLYFTPNEKIREAITPYLSRKKGFAK